MHRTVGDGVAKVRNKVGERGEHESALGHPRMRYLETRRADHGAGVEQDIDIDRARPFSHGADPAEFALYLAGAGEQLHREECGLRFRHQVEEPALLDVIDGLCLIDRGSAENAKAGRGKPVEGGSQISLAVADVGAETEINRLQNSPGCTSLPMRRFTLK
jgi:hypothetical protein